MSDAMSSLSDPYPEDRAASAKLNQAYDAGYARGYAAAAELERIAEAERAVIKAAEVEFETFQSYPVTSQRYVHVLIRLHKAVRALQAGREGKPEKVPITVDPYK